MKIKHTKYFLILCIAHSSVVLPFAFPSLRERFAGESEQVKILEQKLKESEQAKKEEEQNSNTKDNKIQDLLKIINTQRVMMESSSEEIRKLTEEAKYNNFTKTTFVGGVITGVASCFMLLAAVFPTE